MHLVKVVCDRFGSRRRVFRESLSELRPRIRPWGAKLHVTTVAYGICTEKLAYAPWPETDPELMGAMRRGHVYADSVQVRMLPGVRG